MKRRQWKLGTSVVNHHFFDVIDTEEKAYWLGFFSADGTIVGRSISLTLQEKDKPHLELYRQHLGIGNQIKKYTDRKGFTSYYVRFSSQQIVDSLEKLGVFKNKSYALSPATVPTELEQHYIRGLIDGDGGFSFSQNRKQKVFQFHFCGLDTMVDYVADKIFLVNGTKPKKRLNNSKINFGINMANRKALNFADFLYNEATIYLERKHNLYILAKEKYKRRNMYYLNSEFIASLLEKQGLSLLGFCKKNNLSQSSLWSLYRNKKKATYKTIEKLSGMLRVDINLLIKGV